MTNLIYLSLNAITIAGLVYYYSTYVYNKLIMNTIYYFFNEKIVWDNKIDKPSSYIYIFFFIILMMLKFVNTNFNSLEWLGGSMFILSFLTFTHSPLYIKTVSLTINDNAEKTINRKRQNKKKDRMIIDAEIMADRLINKKFFRGKNLRQNIINMLEYRLEEIDKKSITCSFNNKIDVGRILFQLKDLDFFNELAIKNIYETDIIVTSKRESIKENFRGHKKLFKEKELYNDEIDIRKN